MQETLKVGDLQVEPEAKDFGSIKIGETPSSTIELPVGIINGQSQGPVLCLTAGIHACEYVGIEAAIRIFKEIDPKKLKGAIITVPVVNVTGFDRAIPYVCPIDGLNIAFQFPGKPDGSLSQVTAYVLLEKIVSKANYCVDLHGGDLPELLIPYTIFYRTGVEKVDKESIAMAKVYGTEYIEERTPEGGGRLWPITMLSVEASKRGIPSIVAESGIGLGTYEEKDILIHINGIKNIMRYLGMIKGAPTKCYQTQKLWNDVAEVRVRRGGLFYPEVRLGDIVSKEQKLGYVKNLRGEVVEEVISPTDGFILLIFPKHVVYTGDVVFNIGRNIREL